MKKQNKKLKKRNEQKNLRLHICFFFNLFFGLKNKKQEMGRKI
jgi:hypothetical protein